MQYSIPWLHARSEYNSFMLVHTKAQVNVLNRYSMWIIGNEQTLTSNDEVWKAMISDAKGRECVTNPGDHPEMTKLIRHVKEELNQLAELLNPNSVLFNGTMWKVNDASPFLFYPVIHPHL